MKPRILVVADDAAFRATLARWLLGAGYAVELSESVHRAREIITNESVNLAIDNNDATMMRGKFKIAKWFAPGGQK